MKKTHNLISMIAFTSIIVFFMQSCSVGGLLIGSIMDSTDDTDYEVPIKTGEGWIAPDSKNDEARILLNNGKSVKGKYLGTEKIYSGGDSIDVVLIKSNNQIKKIPVDIIAYTKIHKNNKNHAQSGFLVGIGVDLFIVAMVAASGGFSFGPAWSGSI
ncbi:MAG: hypothetical protein HKN68_11060 [Saprospiraceae bacterium]|nr:hypothetical protein [Saprospiraceae bacterium]